MITPLIFFCEYFALWAFFQYLTFFPGIKLFDLFAKGILMPRLQTIIAKLMPVFAFNKFSRLRFFQITLAIEKRAMPFIWIV
jgi:hypothetical protein